MEENPAIHVVSVGIIHH